MSLTFLQMGVGTTIAVRISSAPLAILSRWIELNPIDDNTCPADTIVVDYSWDCGGFLGLACWCVPHLRHHMDFGWFLSSPINEAQLCCKPPGGSIATAPFTLGEIFDSPPQDEDLTWDVQEENIGQRRWRCPSFIEAHNVAAQMKTILKQVLGTKTMYGLYDVHQG